jgi:hypothetical protein
MSDRHAEIAALRAKMAEWSAQRAAIDDQFAMVSRDLRDRYRRAIDQLVHSCATQIRAIEQLARVERQVGWG